MSRKRLSVLLLVVAIVIIASFLVFSLLNKQKNNKSIPTSQKNLTENSEVNKTSSCIISPEEFCSEYRITKYRSRGMSIDALIINLPEGTPIYSPIEGLLSITAKIEEKADFKGSYIVISSKENQKSEVRIIGDINFEKIATKDVQKGEIIGKIGNSGVDNLGGYNLIILPTKEDEMGKVILDENLKNMLFHKE